MLLTCRIGLNRTMAGSEYSWWDGTSVGQGVVGGEAWPHWAWLQPQLALRPGHDCVAAWADYRYERFLGSDGNASQVGDCFRLEGRHNRALHHVALDVSVRPWGPAGVLRCCGLSQHGTPNKHLSDKHSTPIQDHIIQCRMPPFVCHRSDILPMYQMPGRQDRSAQVKNSA
jgi:hypothetical protein